MAVRTPRSKIAPEGFPYKISMISGLLTTVAAGDSVFSMLWTNTAKRCLVWKFSWHYTYMVVFTAAQEVVHQLWIARGTTVADSGGTAATLTTTNAKMDSLDAVPSAMGDMRIAAATGLTAGTRTLDAQGMVTRGAWCAAALASGVYSLPVMENDFGLRISDNPITLRAGEQICLRNTILMGAAGVIKLYVDVEWSEVDVGVV